MTEQISIMFISVLQMYSLQVVKLAICNICAVTFHYELNTDCMV